MNERRGMAGRTLSSVGLLLAVLLNTSSGTAQGQSLPVRNRQSFAQEPPLADGAIPNAQVASLHPPTPVVSIRVDVPSKAIPGRELEYRFSVDNTSQAEAHHVHVRVPLPSGTRYKVARPAPGTPAATGELSWDLGTIKGGQHREITLVVDVEPTIGDDIRCCARVAFEHGEIVRTKVAKPVLRVRTKGPERVVLYDTPTFVIEVTNSGSNDATDVVLSEELPPGLEFSDSNPSTNGANPLIWKIGTLAPGETRNVQFKVIAKQNGSHTLNASVTASGGAKAIEANVSRVLVGEGKLTIIKTGPRWCSVGRSANYLLTISNPGSVPATNVQLSDVLYYAEKVQSAIEFVSASDDGRLIDNEVRWMLGTLAPGARRTVSLQLRAKQSGDFENVARVKADPNLTAAANCKTEFASATGLILDVDKQSDPVAVGKSTIFTFLVRQRGGTTANQVTLSVVLPEGLQYVDATGKTAGKQEGRTVTFAPLAELPSGSDAIYTVTVRAERAGEVSLRASLTSDPPQKSGPVQREESTTIVPESAISTTPATPAPAAGK